MVQALPVLHALKSTWPTCQVDWITGEVGATLLEGHPLLNKVIVYPRKRLGDLAKNPLLWPALISELGSLSRRLKNGRYEIALDIQGLFKSGLIALLSNARLKVGFAGTREGSAMFLNRKLPPYDPNRHAVVRYLDAAASLGARAGKIKFPLGLTTKDTKEAMDFLQGLRLEPGQFIILIPGTIWPSKHWTIEGFSRLAVLVKKRLGLASVVVGSHKDEPLGNAIFQGSQGAAIDITGKTSLKLLASLSSMAASGVTTDTGPMHLAAAAGLNVVALFGPTAPWRTGPFGKGHIVIRKDMECSPCFNRECAQRKCMYTISPEEVFEAVERLVSLRKTANRTDEIR